MAEFGPAGRSLRAKRRSVSPAALKRRYPGSLNGDERANVRMSKGLTQVLLGNDDLSDWDDDELRAGRRRDKNGRFSGQVPTVIPKALHDELVKRTLRKADELMRDNLNAAVEVLVDIVKDNQTDAKDRLKAVDMIMNRVMGKEPAKVEISGGDKPWQVAITTSIVSMPDELDPEDPGDDEDDDEGGDD